MSRPQPKHEIKIIRPEQSTAMLIIFAASADAQQWIDREAPLFGRYFPQTESSHNSVLHVSPLFDPDEVSHWLGSQGQDGKPEDGNVEEI